MMIKTIKILKHSQRLEKTLWLNLNAFLITKLSNDRTLKNLLSPPPKKQFPQNYLDIFLQKLNSISCLIF